MDDFLVTSKLETVGTAFQPEPLEINPLLQALVERIRASAPNHTLELVESGESRRLLLDRKLILQAFTNLLSNAIKYSPDGGCVRIEVCWESEQVLARISDQGIGIPEADQKRLFEQFHRASNIGAIQGTGLGLAIVKRAVEVHHGTITVESTLGQGTTFIVRLPIGLSVE